MTHQILRLLRPLAVSTPHLTLAALLLGVLAPRAASATQSAELLRTQAYFYGRFEARVRFAPGEGVVSSFFLWRDGSSSMTSWNELDYEKINSDCRLQTNIWTGKGTQSAMINTPSFNICNDYHTYAFEWTPDYIAWLIDGTQIRKVTGASVTEYTQNASQGMTIHFNIWAGNSGFGGTLDPSILPVHEYISWVQYSSYANGAFQLQWREEFNGATTPSGWMEGTWASPYNLSTHNRANVGYVNGIAVLSMTADNATGNPGTPPVDSSGAGGASGTGGAGGTGRGGAGGAGTGGAGRGGSGGSGGGMSGGGGRGGTGGSASGGSGGISATGSGGTGGATGGNGAGGVSAGAAGDGAGGVSAGAAGDGAGGVSPGTGGSGTGASGSGGATASGGAPGSGGTSSGGAGPPTEPGAGCGCGVAGGLTRGGGLIALLLIAACSLRRRRAIGKRRA